MRGEAVMLYGPLGSLLARLRAFLVRDFFIETSYRLAFLMNVGGVVINTFIFFFLAQLVGDRAAPFLRAYDGDYFAFLLIGVAFAGYFGVGLNSFARALRLAQTTGTLEAMVMTPTPVSLIILGSAVWSYTFTTFRVFIYLIVGALFLGLNLGGANYAAALVSLLLSIIAFASIGVIAASVIMVIKSGDPITALFSNLANLIGGVFYPVEILPPWLQALANALPITYALRAMRLALLADASWAEVAPDMLALVAFCVALLPLSLLIFRYAVEHARLDGSLAHY